MATPTRHEDDDQVSRQIREFVNEDLDIDDEVFINEEGVDIPQRKTRKNVIEFNEKMNGKVFKKKEQSFKAEAVKYKVEKALSEYNNENNILNVLIGIGNKLDVLQSDFKVVKEELKGQGVELRRQGVELTTVREDVQSIKADVGDIKPLMLYVQTSENARRRKADQPQIPVPFLEGAGPEGTDLPPIESVGDIERLTLNELERYLAGYKVTYTGRIGKKRMKNMLRDRLGFTSVKDIRFEFS